MKPFSRRLWLSFCLTVLLLAAIAVLSACNEKDLPSQPTATTARTYQPSVVTTAVTTVAPIPLTPTYTAHKKADGTADYYAVTGYTGNGSELLIPGYHENLPVVLVSPGAFANCTTLKKVTLGDNILAIGYRAFYNCSALTDVSFGRSVAYIDERVFENCVSLQSLVIPDSVEDIRYAALAGCRSLTVLTLPFIGASRTVANGQIASYAANRSPILMDFTDQTTDGGARVYNAADSLLGYIFGGREYVAGSVPASATFQGEERLVELYHQSETYRFCYNIPASLHTVIVTDAESLPEYAFFGCKSLYSIVLPAKMTTIGVNAVAECPATVYSEAATAGAGWNADWNPGHRIVYFAGEWGYLRGVPTPTN